MESSCPPGAIGFDPIELDFEAEEGDNNPPRQYFKVINIGPPGSILGSYHAKSLADWVSVDLDNAGISEIVKVVSVGKPAGEYEFKIEVDAPTATNSPQYLPCKLTISPKPTPPQPLKIITATLPDAVRGKPYVCEVEAEGGKLPYSWSCVGLPRAGLTFDSQTAQISGTPATSGSFSVTVSAKDSEGKSAEMPYTLNVVEPVVNVAITSPSGGEVWYVGDTHDIAWVADNKDDGQLEIDLYSNGVWSVIANVPIQSLKYSWLIQGDAVGEGDIIRLVPSNGHGGQSDAFVVRQPSGCAVPWLRLVDLLRRRVGEIWCI
jgi:hypothetical protein